jgi:hypothetical protein
VIRAVGVRKEKIAGIRIGRTQGNLAETISKNEKLYDYFKVPQDHLDETKKWFGALKPSAKTDAGCAKPIGCGRSGTNPHSKSMRLILNS